MSDFAPADPSVEAHSLRHTGSFAVDAAELQVLKEKFESVTGQGTSDGQIDKLQASQLPTLRR